MWSWILSWLHWMWVCSTGCNGISYYLFYIGMIIFWVSDETYELRNNLVVRPFRTHHAIPSQVCFTILLFILTIYLNICSISERVAQNKSQ